MAERLKTKQEDFTVGREGLKLPIVEDFRIVQNFDVFRVMRLVWELNDYDISRESSYRGVQYPQRRFSYELVLPATSEKPLAVLRASYEPRDGLAIEAEAQYRRHDMDTTVTIGNETYGIYTTPATAGPFIPLLETSYSHSRGGSGSWSGPHADIRWLGEPMGNMRLKMPHYPEWPEDKQYEADDAAYAMKLRGLIGQTLEFLS